MINNKLIAESIIVNALFKFVSIMVLLSIQGCFTECGNEINAQKHSPNNELMATLFERDCGATTDFSQIISITYTSKKFDADDSESYVFSMQGRPKIEILWASDKELLIIRPEIKEDIFTNATQWNDVKIIYRSSRE